VHSLLLCTEDDNNSYRNVCKMSVVSFALAVIFIISPNFAATYARSTFLELYLIAHHWEISGLINKVCQKSGQYSSRIFGCCCKTATDFQVEFPSYFVIHYRTKVFHLEQILILNGKEEIARSQTVSNHMQDSQQFCRFVEQFITWSNRDQWNSILK